MKTPDFDEGWSELPAYLWRDGRKKARTVRLFADENIDAQLLERIKSKRISVRSALGEGLSGRSDSDVLQWCNRNRRVILTRDGDFWDDRAFPLQQVPGVILLHPLSGTSGEALTLFDFFYQSLGKIFPTNWWHGKKVRVGHNGSLFLKLRTPDGRVAWYQFKVASGRILVQDVSPTRFDRRRDQHG
jgi:predicted nuclease of predicted toxin-antitoxin system